MILMIIFHQPSQKIILSKARVKFYTFSAFIQLGHDKTLRLVRCCFSRKVNKSGQVFIFGEIVHQFVFDVHTFAWNKKLEMKSHLM